MTTDEIRLRRLHGQHLLVPADAHIVIRDLCGLQAQFLSNALHALRIRSNGFDEGNLSGYVKSWTLRGTMHVFEECDLPLMLHRGRTHALRPCDTLSGDEIISKERKQMFAELIVESIRKGVGEREQLKQLCFDAGMTKAEAQSVFNPWGGTIRALCESGAITHAVSEKKAFIPCPPFEPMQRETARLELAQRYFTHYGPATVRDAAYFFGYPQGEIRSLLAQLPVQEIACGAQTHYYIEESVPKADEILSCIFLAGFDPLMLGYEKKDNPFLPQAHLRGIFSLAGIVMPAVLLNGRVVGRWKRAGKKLMITAFETIGAHDAALIREEAERLFAPITKIEGI